MAWMRAVLLLLGTAALTAAGPTPPRVLRVCADPNNLPFSDRKGQGFENKLAERLAQDLGASLEYTWFPQRRGFFRHTLNAKACDVVMGVPTAMQSLATTHPYYRSSYVFVYGPKSPRVHTLDDPALRQLRIGIPLVGEDGNNPPPLQALAARQLDANAKGYLVTGNYLTPSPPADLVRAVSAGDVDLAIAWGPLGGYFASRATPPLDVAPVPEADAAAGQPFAFDISAGVRKDDLALRDELNGLLDKDQTAIAALLDSYGVPRLTPSSTITPQGDSPAGK